MRSKMPDLNKISPSFCAAKWLNVTIRLQNGHNHSCHHPVPHKIDLEEVKKNPGALHDTQFKKEQRKLMLEGTRPPECVYCWKVEDLPGDQISDRFIKSNEFWARPYINEIAKKTWDQASPPTYLEVSFSNLCNFKCAYCFPDSSSKWMSEIQEFGPYPTSDQYGTMKYEGKDSNIPLPDDNNPYVDAFWKWIPDVFTNLKVLRVTGGEPLLSKDCLKLIDFIKQNPNPDLNFSLNSNLGVPSHLVEKMMLNLTGLISEKKIKNSQIFTSLDTWGSHAEYLRFGLDLDLWKKNLDIVLQHSAKLEVRIMVAFNALSVFRFKEFLKFVMKKRKQYKTAPLVDISILQFPDFLNLLLLEEKDKEHIYECVQYMEAHSDKNVPYGFKMMEILKLKRIWEYSKIKKSDEELLRLRKDFMKYVTEYDRRKKVDIFEMIPEIYPAMKKWQQEQNLALKTMDFKKNIDWQLRHNLPVRFRNLTSKVLDTF